MAKSKNKKGAQALDAFKGFAAQPTRMALLLLKANPGSFVSLELFEDVGVTDADGSQVASQMKTGNTNPLSNKAEPLWKTFANWTRQVRDREVDPTRTTFELHVERAKPGSIVKTLAESHTTVAAAENAVLMVRDALWGKEPDFVSRPKVAATLQPHLDTLFLKQADRRAFAAIIQRFRFTVAGKPALEELHGHLVDTMGIDPTVLEKVMVYFHGWVLTECQRQINATGKPPVIPRDVAWKEFHSYYRSLVSGGTLPDAADKPTTADYAALLGLPFLQQLDLIKADAGTRDFAMTCFFQAGSARTRWVERGLVREESMDAVEKSLLQAHTDIRNSEYRPDLSAEHQGRALLGKCHQYKCSVEHKDPPDYFVPGCFHWLSDRRRLGWHPEYEKLLQGVA